MAAERAWTVKTHHMLRRDRLRLSLLLLGLGAVGYWRT